MNNDLSNLYPQSPTNIPSDLTKLPSSYQIRAALAVLAILLFFVLYTALVVGLGYLVYFAFIYDMGDINKLTLLLKFGAIAGAVMLFVFTLKFIFKLKNHKPTNRIKLKKKDHPNLWSFVDQICKETGAPKPKNIYVDPDVNAYVSYTNAWLSLLLPVRKELTIGMGLVSCLNLSEFKAVITHEFGHFAQRSMKIGSYIMSANTIIHDMIYNRDSWDDMLDKWRASDLRLSAAAWVITPIIWLIRQVLALFYQFLNIMYSSLSREMEFNADKVAVSTSGSDAIISALWKLDNGAECWNSTVQHAYLAGQKKTFVKNLYTHNLNALARNENLLEEQLEALPVDERGGKHFFSTSNVSKVNMYASHPPNNMREDNAKQPYIPCNIDHRSPWMLFDGDLPLQEQMTKLVYKQYLQKIPKEFVGFEAFESFIKREQKGKEQLAAYHNTFEHRFLIIPDTAELQKEAEALGNVDEQYISHHKNELASMMKDVNDLQDLMQTAVGIAQGTTNETSFSFGGQTYAKNNLEQGYQKVADTLNQKLNEGFLEWDKKYCGYYLKKAKEVNKENELTKIFDQHRLLTYIYQSINNEKNRIYHQLEVIQQKEDLKESELHAFGRDITSTVFEFNSLLDQLEDSKFVALPNIENINDLKHSITDNGKFIKEKGPIFENGNIGKVLNSLEQTVGNLQRIDQKSVSLVLETCEQINEMASTPQ